MKRTLHLFLLIVCLFPFLGQAQPGNAGHLFGKIIDSRTNKPMESVSVVLSREINFKDSVIAGMFTKNNGEFLFENVPFGDSLLLRVTAVGYKDEQQVVNFAPTPGVASPEMDLGNIVVQPRTEELDNVVVTASRPTMTMGIDRRVFNVEKSLTSTGGTAVDLMRNIPSLTVDVEGNVSLRNASPQIFVDGRPTILTLDQIPASDIEKVELITNPSAKFDAASSGGIINVVMKKNRKLGLNGNASVSGGSPNILGANLALNLRQGKFNFFVSGNYNKSGGNADGKTFRQNKSNGIIDNYFNQYSQNDRNRQFESIRFGVDYFMNNRNILTITENLVHGKFSNTEEQRQEYLDSQEELIRTGNRISEGNASFNRASTQLLYTHKFASTGHQLTADVNFNTGNRDNMSTIINNYYKPDGSLYANPNRVNNDGDNDSKQITVQLDYVNPISENAKFEAGLRSYSESSTSIYNVYGFDSNNVSIKLPLSNNYKFNENVNAAYATFSNKISKFTYQVGLRAEVSDFKGKLVDRDQEFGYTYPDNWSDIWNALFPSLFLTRNLSEGSDIQLNYSRRIRRPRFWQLNPYVDINDPVNIRQGNPNIRPEFTNSLELNYSKTYSSGNLLASVYVRNTTGDITQYSDTITAAQYEQLNNAAIDPNAILNTFINAKYQNRVGLDLTVQQKIGKNLELVPNVNLQYRKVNADVAKLNLSNEGWSFEGKLIANYKIDAPNSWLFKNIGLQMTGEYESPRVIPQGRRKEQYSVDFAMKKDMFKDKKGTLTFSIDDVFNTRRWGTIYDTENFYQDSYSRWNVRSFRLTFSYRFGDADFTFFKRPQRGGNDRGRDDDNGSAPPDAGTK